MTSVSSDGTSCKPRASRGSTHPTTLKTLVSAAAVSIALCSALMVRGASPDAPAPYCTHQSEAGGAFEQPEAVPSLTLEVVDEASHKPLPGASLWVCAMRGRTHTWEAKTDYEGRYVKTTDTAPQDIRLTRRRPFAVRVVDARGQPVAGAVVACRQDVSYGPLGWETETDADGRFVWYDAPTSGSVFLRRQAGLRAGRAIDLSA